MSLVLVGYPVRLWVVVVPVWIAVLAIAVLPYAGAPPVWLTVGLAVATVALGLRWVRGLAMLAPAAGLVARASDESMATVLVGLAGVAGAVVVIGLLDGWDGAGPDRARAGAVRCEGTGTWLRERLAALAPPLMIAMTAGVGWAVLALLSWSAPGWLVVLTPALLATAVVAATYDLWWRPRRDSNPRPPP